DILSFELDAFVLKQLDYPIGRARRKNGAPNNEAANVVEMKTVDILVDTDRAQDFAQDEMRRQRQLDENSVGIGLFVQFQYLVDKHAWIALARKANRNRTDSDLVASLSLVANIDFRRRIVPNHDNGEARRQPVVGLQPFDTLAALPSEEMRNSFSINDLCNQYEPPAGREIEPWSLSPR